MASGVTDIHDDGPVPDEGLLGRPIGDRQHGEVVAADGRRAAGASGQDDLVDAGSSRTSSRTARTPGPSRPVAGE